MYFHEYLMKISVTINSKRLLIRNFKHSPNAQKIDYKYETRDDKNLDSIRFYSIFFKMNLIFAENVFRIKEILFPFILCVF